VNDTFRHQSFVATRVGEKEPVVMFDEIQILTMTKRIGRIGTQHATSDMQSGSLKYEATEAVPYRCMPAITRNGCIPVAAVNVGLIIVIA